MSIALPGHPGFVFRGKTYKTITGLYNALAKDSGASCIGGVSSKNTITASVRAADSNSILKVYAITPPVAGQRQYVAEAFLKNELDRARRNALVASAYNVVVATRKPGTPHNLPGNIKMASAGLPDEARALVMDCKIADMLPREHRFALLCAYSEVLMREQQSGQQMLYTFVDCMSALQFVNA